MILPRVPASVLLAAPRTACLAAGADAGQLSDASLCDAVVASMAKGSASWYQRHMAVVAAAMRGRYDAMVRAMENARMEPVIIEDLIKIGEDRGASRYLGALMPRVERRLGRRLSAEERARILERFFALEPERLLEALLDLEPAALARWLADPDAR